MPGSSLSGFSPTRQIRDKKNKKTKKKRNMFNSRQAVRSNPLMGDRPQVEVTQGSRLWPTSTLKPLDLPTDGRTNDSSGISAAVIPGGKHTQQSNDPERSRLATSETPQQQSSIVHLRLPVIYGGMVAPVRFPCMSTDMLLLLYSSH